MEWTLKNRIETISNVALLVVTLLVGCLTLYNQFWHPKNNPSKQLIGHRIDLNNGVQFDANRTLILYLSTKCHYCEASTPFYQKLAVQLSQKIPIIAAFPQKEEEARTYLTERKITIARVISAPQLLRIIQGTPTLMLVDKTGKVVDAWVGQLPPPIEQQVLKEAGK